MPSATEYLNELTSRLANMPAKERQKLEKDALAATKSLLWVPNPGAQTEAFECRVDELLYGGTAGSGKTDLGVGKALQKHRKSLLLRRVAAEVPFLIERAEQIIGHKRGFNGQYKRWHLDTGRTLQFGGCQHLGDERDYKGERKDLIYLDEASEFLEQQTEFLAGWLGSTDPNQLCQLVLGTNPPQLADGMWLVEWFGPWVDENHALYPTPYGEPLWYVRGPKNGAKFLWLHSPESVVVEGRTIKPRSRTFIRGELTDNPDLANSGYGDQLMSMRSDLRAVYAEGNFMAGMSDQERQVIPTAWIKAAQDRWRPDGFRGETMTCIALDPAGGGRDSAEIAYRYGCWFGPPVSKQGIETRDGQVTAATVIEHRRNQCPIVVDVGGGYAGAVLERFKDNNIECQRFDGSKQSSRRSKKDKLRFANERSAAWWEFGEALDPEQEGGSPIELPPDAELRGDLAAPTFKIGARGIQVCSKDDIRDLIGRSPGKGDAVVMCYSAGNRALMRRHDRTGMSYAEQNINSSNGGGRSAPRVIMGHMGQRRR